MSKQAEEAAIKAYPECMCYNDLAQEFEDVNGCYRVGFEVGYEQAEQDFHPIIRRLAEAILFDWDNKAEIAKEALKQIEEL